MSDKSLLERIKKLLSITEENGASEREAISAALMAQRLMAKLNISETDLIDPVEEPAKDPITGSAAIKRHEWQLALARTIAKNFRCLHYLSSHIDPQRDKRVSDVVFYGHSQDAEAATLVYERLCVVARRLGNAYARKRRKELEAQSTGRVSQSSIFNTWISAFIEGVSSELERQSQELMIVVPRDVKHSYREYTKDFVSYTPRNVRRLDDYTTKSAGRSAGRDSVRSGRVGTASSGTTCVGRSHRLPA